MSFTPIESQEQFDELVRDRLARERAKYSDYEDLKAKAAKYDEAQEAGRSELEKAQARVRELEAEAEGRREADRVREIRERVSKETGVPAELISGSDEESMTESANGIAAYAKAKVPAAPRLGGSGRFADGGASTGPGARGAIKDLDAAFFGADGGSE